MKTLLLATTLALSLGALAAPGAPATGAVAAPAVARSPYEIKTQAAREQFNAKDFVGAQKTMEAALELAQTPTEKTDALRRLGQAFDGQKKYAEARATWQKMLPLLKDSPGDLFAARVIIAVSYSTEKKWQQFLDAFPALEDAPLTTGKGALQFTLATAYIELNQGEKARDLLGLVIADENSPEGLRNFARVATGQSYFDEANFDAARQSYEEVTKLKDVAGDVLIATYTGLGRIAEKQNRADDAQTVFAQARSLLMQKADGQFKAKDFEGAIVSYKQALSTGVPDPRTELVAHMQLGTASQSLGDNDAAITEFQYIVDTEPIESDLNQPQVLKMMKPLALMGLARGHVAKKQFEPARTALNRFMDYDDVLSLLSRKEAESLLQSLPPAP